MSGRKVLVQDYMQCICSKATNTVCSKATNTFIAILKYVIKLLISLLVTGAKRKIKEVEIKIKEIKKYKFHKNALKCHSDNFSCL